VPRNRRELVHQWTAVHGVTAQPVNTELRGRATRERYSNGTITVVESILVDRRGHGFPIDSRDPLTCGRLGDFVVEAGVCAVAEILRLWGLLSIN